MADIDYPTELPPPLRSGYGLQHASPMLRTQLQSGRARQRRTYTSVPTMAAVSWLLSDGEARLFETFFRYGLSDGTEWFNARLVTPTGLRDYECRFADMYSGPDLVGVRHWKITAQLEIKERETFPAAFLETPEWILEPGLLDLAISELPEE